MRVVFLSLSFVILSLCLRPSELLAEVPATVPAPETTRQPEVVSHGQSLPSAIGSPACTADSGCPASACPALPPGLGTGRPRCEGGTCVCAYSCQIDFACLKVMCKPTAAEPFVVPHCVGGTCLCRHH